MKNKFIELARLLAEQTSKTSEDPHRKVGACILDKTGRVLSLGYNGLAPNKKVKLNFWDNRDFRRTYMIHAEMNALSCLSRYSNPYMIYTNLLPCGYCANLIASYDIREVYYGTKYDLDNSAVDIFKFYNIKLKNI
jgi:dCMP deaminase